MTRAGFWPLVGRCMLKRTRRYSIPQRVHIAGSPRLGSAYIHYRNTRDGEERSVSARGWAKWAP